MTKKIRIFTALIFTLTYFTASSQCLNAFLDSINSKILSMHDGRFHVTFNFVSKLLPNTLFYEGTAYFSKDSATPDNIADFIMFEKDTIPAFGYMGGYFYKFDAVKKNYTRQYLRRENFVQKTTFDFQHFLAVPYLLNDFHYPFDGYLRAAADSLFCDPLTAGYMKADTLSSAQYGQQIRKSYRSVQLSSNGRTIKMQSADDFAGDVKTKLWIIDSMAPIKNGEKFVTQKIKQYTQAYTQTAAPDLDDKNWVAPPPPPQPGEILLLDTVPVNTFLKTLEYKPYALDNAGGKLLLLDFWFANCRPCIEAMPQLENLYKAYKSNGLAVIGINTFDFDMDIVKGILTKNGIDYPVCLDSEAELAKKIGIQIYPTMLLVDPTSKKVYYSYIGVADFNDVEKNIKSLLNVN